MDSYWNALLEGKSGVSYLSSVHTNMERRPIGSEVPDFHPKDYIRPKKNIKIMSRDIQLGVVSAVLASRNANLSFEEGSRSVEPERFGCIFGCDLIGLELELVKDAFRKGIVDGRYDFSTWGSASMSSIMPLWMLKYLPNLVASNIAISLDARGPNNTPTLERGSSLAAIQEACRIIERGSADVMVAGGSGNRVNPTVYSRCSAFELAPWTENPEGDPRPFDKNRRGAVIGEGAAAFILEEKEFAIARGVKPLAVVRSFAESVKPTASFGIEREAIETSIRLALKRAGLKPEDIDHVNANAMGLSSDSAEALAIANTIGDAPVFTVCGHFGNLGSGAGAVELAASILALEKDRLPATRNCDVVSPDCPIDVVHGTSRGLKTKTFIKLNHENTGRSFAVIMEKF